MTTVDWLIVILYLSLTVFIGLYYRRQAGKNMNAFFLGSRNLPWYMAGLSMVATTFAADTPLWVTERVAINGISGNWIWWNMLIGGMLTTFFFAQLWRRAGVLTELEFVELRYSGVEAAILRGFKSVYMGLFLNAIIIGWVNAAMMIILKTFFGISDFSALLAVVILMVLVALYSSMSGLKGVIVTDVIQFTLAMSACIVLAILTLSTEEVGGIEGLTAKLPEWRFEFFPVISQSDSFGAGAEVLSVTIGAFLTYGLVQWWASWYPGNEPGGGGYIAQRIMGTKNEKNALFSVLLFQFAHYCLRPWPWIIVALCSLILYPDLAVEDAGQGFVMTMRDFLPPGLKGLLFVAFLAAYMSTISTQLNWGSSFLSNDLYKRFIKPAEKFTDSERADRHYVVAGRLFTIFIMLVSVIPTGLFRSINQAAEFLISCGAGLGLVLILRWYYWRINAWSEITAVLTPFGAYLISESMSLEFPTSFLVIAGITTLAWVTVTFLTPPSDRETLMRFSERVRPLGFWGPFNPDKDRNGDLKFRFICWFFAVAMTYCSLFTIGYIIFQNWMLAGLNLSLSITSLLGLKWSLSKIEIFD